MKRLYFLLIILFLISACSGQEMSFTEQLQKADTYWTSNKPGKAEKKYAQLIGSDIVPAEYKSLVYLRLAEAQLQSDKKADCLNTLDQMSAKLPRIREHHLLRMDELRLLANGKTPV